MHDSKPIFKKIWQFSNFWSDSSRRRLTDRKRRIPPTYWAKTCQASLWDQAVPFRWKLHHFRHKNLQIKPRIIRGQKAENFLCWKQYVKLALGDDDLDGIDSTIRHGKRRKQLGQLNIAPTCWIRRKKWNDIGWERTNCFVIPVFPDFPASTRQTIQKAHNLHRPYPATT